MDALGIMAEQPRFEPQRVALFHLAQEIEMRFERERGDVM